MELNLLTFYPFNEYGLWPCGNQFSPWRRPPRYAIIVDPEPAHCEIEFMKTYRYTEFNWISTADWVFNMGLKKDPKQLAKFLAYLLGRRPDEFGLVPDRDGYVKIKDLLKSLSEEDGWKYVRRSNLDEILLTLDDRPFEIDDNRIRAADRSALPQSAPADVENMPPLLYTCIRKKAYPAVAGKPVRPSNVHGVLLTPDQDMALRIGRRIDSNPVMLTIHVQTCIDSGTLFMQSGEQLYTAPEIPAEGYTGPSLLKEKKEALKNDKRKQDKEKENSKPFTPGGFFLDLDKTKEEKEYEGRKRRKKDIEREKDRKLNRRRKERLRGEEF